MFIDTDSNVYTFCIYIYIYIYNIYRERQRQRDRESSCSLLFTSTTYEMRYCQPKLFADYNFFNNCSRYRNLYK